VAADRIVSWSGSIFTFLSTLTLALVFGPTLRPSFRDCKHSKVQYVQSLRSERTFRAVCVAQTPAHAMNATASVTPFDLVERKRGHARVWVRSTTLVVSTASLIAAILGIIRLPWYFYAIMSVAVVRPPLALVPKTYTTTHLQIQLSRNSY
jgi:hypothetical protein